MGSVAHINEDRKDLAKDVHILFLLGFSLINILDGGVIVKNGYESFWEVGRVEKKDTHPKLLELNGAIHQQRVEVFSQGRDGVIHY